jgi:Plasmid replication region DNA-binding N-term
MSDPSTKAYGEGRMRTNVAYAEIERAAIAILKSKRRPTVDTVREAVGRGSNDTIGEGLRRFWRDLGARMEGDPAALTRMPAEIAELADGMWQRALKLAAEAAQHDDNAAGERLAQLQIETDTRAHSLALREHELDTQARERERALADSRVHLLLTLKSLAREQETIRARQARIADLEAQIEGYRTQLTKLILAAAAKKQASNPPTTARSPSRTSTPRPTSSKRPSRAKPKTNAKFRRHGRAK